MKFSMKQQGERFTLSTVGKLMQLGDWIIKTPSITHEGVPQNEYSMMKLAQLAGIEIPKIQLIHLNQLDNLPPLNLPNEEYAYAIERFDRETINSQPTQRIHSEDFAQILNKYPHDKYDGGNYAQIGKILYQYSHDGLADVQQLARRLLVNILLG
ncbi:HipA domain-containing protein, partial [Xanthomonas citri pv. citri]